MTQTSPPAFSGLSVAAALPAERAAFLKKVYLLVLAGVLAFAGTLWAAGNVAPVQELASGLWRAIAGSRLGWLLYFGIMIGGFWVVHALARSFPLNLIAFFTWSFVLGLLAAPPVLHFAAHAPDVLTTAAAVTALVFTGLSGYVLLTRKDFSFLGGILALAMIGLLVLAVCGAIFGFGMPLWISGAGALLFAGYILYDTSRVLHRYPTDMAVSAAVTLFTDVVYLFLDILRLLGALRSSD